MRKSRGERTESEERKRKRERETEDDRGRRKRKGREENGVAKCLSGMPIARSCSCRCSRQEDGSKREEKRDFSGLLALSRIRELLLAERATELAEM